MEYLTLIETVELELAGADRRLAVATQSLKDFDLEFADKSVSPELARALANERLSLECELDAARRRREDCQQQLRDLKLFSKGEINV
jgi:hypothetical protein